MTKKFIRFGLLITIVLSSFGKLYAQDPQYTQFYAASMYLNPGFTGLGSCGRLSLNYRNQWGKIPGIYESYLLTYDSYLPNFSSGVGIMMNREKEGEGDLRNTAYSLLYSYQLGLTRRWNASAGFQATYNFHGISFEKLIFGDQISNGGNTPTVEDPTENLKYFDASAGLVVYSKKYWVGFAAHHLNRPDQSLIGGDAGERMESKLPIKYSLHGGAKFPLGKTDAVKKNMDTEAISPAFNYKGQGKFDQMDVGMYYIKPPMSVGIWYRGIPIFKHYEKGEPNNDAVALLIGFSKDRFKLGYSYDITISKLSSFTGGAHEISLSYQFCDPKKLKKKKKKKKLLVPCPKF